MSINQEIFASFLKQTSIKMKGKPFAIFMDNLGVHRTHMVRDVMENLGIIPIYGAPYRPEYNGIEYYWAQVKAIYRKKLLKKVLTCGTNFENRDLIYESIKEVRNEIAISCHREGMRRIEAIN